MKRSIWETVEQRYNRWWKGKLVRLVNQSGEFRRVRNVRFIGPPSGVYGTGYFTFEDGSECPIHTASFKPTKKDVEVKNE